MANQTTPFKVLKEGTEVQLSQPHISFVQRQKWLKIMTHLKAQKKIKKNVKCVAKRDKK